MSARHYVVGSRPVNAIARTPPRLVAAAVVATWLAIGAGVFQPLYLTIHTLDGKALGALWSEAPFRRIPGLREMLLQVEARTKVGDRVLLWTPHRPWQGGYGYAFRRAQYVLAGREVIPLLDRTRDVVDERSIERAQYVACWPECPPLAGFDAVWRDASGMLLRRR